VTIDIFAAALRFAAAGCSVVPVASDGSKRPALDSWKRYQSEMPTEENLRKWFETSQGVGLITGHISGNLEMLELEGRAVAAGLHTQARDMAQQIGLGDLWERINLGYCEITPSGGLH